MTNGAFTTLTETTSCLGERILVDAEGNRVIAASRRPDGSLRKELRIRPGYIHKEERERFMTRGTQFRQRVEEMSKFPIGFTPQVDNTVNTKKKAKKKSKKPVDVDDPPVIEVETFTGVAPSAKRPDISQTVTKTGTSSFTLETSSPTPNLSGDHVTLKHLPPPETGNGSTAEILSAPHGISKPGSASCSNPDCLNATTLNKRIQQTKTKLKQIAEIEKKIAAGSVKVTPEQYDRVKAKEQLVATLQELETKRADVV